MEYEPTWAYLSEKICQQSQKYQYSQRNRDDTLLPDYFGQIRPHWVILDIKLVKINMSSWPLFIYTFHTVHIPVKIHKISNITSYNMQAIIIINQSPIYEMCYFHGCSQANNQCCNSHVFNRQIATVSYRVLKFGPVRHIGNDRIEGLQPARV